MYLLLISQPKGGELDALETFLVQVKKIAYDNFVLQ
jgi:hypothetical protein